MVKYIETNEGQAVWLGAVHNPDGLCFQFDGIVYEDLNVDGSWYAVADEALTPFVARLDGVLVAGLESSTPVNPIRNARLRYGLTQHQLADLTGVPFRSIQNWEGGQRSCPDYVVRLLLFYLEKLEN